MLPSPSQNLWVANRSAACDQVPLQSWLSGGPDFCQHTCCWGVHGSQPYILLFPSPIPHLEAPTFFLPSPPQCSLSLKEITSLSCVGVDTSAIFYFYHLDQPRSLPFFPLLEGETSLFTHTFSGRAGLWMAGLWMGYEWFLSSRSSTQIMLGSWVNRSAPLPSTFAPTALPTQVFLPSHC